MAETVLHLRVHIPFWWKYYIKLLGTMNRFGLMSSDRAIASVKRVSNFAMKRAAVFVEQDRA